MQTYRQHLEEFKQSTTLNKFKNAVEEALIPNPEERICITHWYF